MEPAPVRKILFVCSQNRWRSRTAQEMYRDFPGYEVRSAGTRREARIRLTGDLIRWAEIVFVMEYAHLERMRREFREEVEQARIVCLKIPDRYEYMNPQLIALLKEKLKPYIQVPE